MDDEDRRKHLEMIQGVITRLAGNSFSIKGWAIALIAVLGSLSAKDSNLWFALLLWLPALCFWGLDAYYLRQEKLFRELYNRVAEGDINVGPFSMDVRPFEHEVDGIVKVARSGTVRWLHIPIVASVILLIILSAVKSCAKKSETPTVVSAPTSTPHASPLPSPVKTAPGKPSPAK